MASKVFYENKANKDLKRIDHKMRQVIMDNITTNLSKIPPAGKLLSGDLRGVYSHRVDDYRVLYVKIPEGVLVLRIGHRREVYK